MKGFGTVWREPLVHFMLIGAALFLFFAWTRTPAENTPNRIMVSASQVEQLTAQFKRTWLRPPTRAELDGLVANFVRDEVYYREALAMGLERDDPQVRRRMRQKLEFILEDLSSVSQPDDQELKAFLQEHTDRFQIDPIVSFNQIYLNPDIHPNLEADANAIIDQLRAGAGPGTLGDPTLMALTFKTATQSTVARAFGQTFAQKVVKMAPGDWVGPIFSGLGAHLVQVTERIPGRLPELDEIRPQVEREYLAQRRQEMKDTTYQKLLQGYEVVMDTSPEDQDMATAIPGEDGQ